MIITPSAKIELTKRKTHNCVTKLEVVSGGCNGFEYVFGTTDNPADLIYIDEVSKEILGDFVLDYVETVFEKGFKLSIPTASSRCGCGTSFGL